MTEKIQERAIEAAAKFVDRRGYEVLDRAWSAEEGISIIPAYVTQKLTNADNLVFIPLIGEEEVVEIIAAWKKASGNLALQQFLGHHPLLKAE